MRQNMKRMLSVLLLFLTLAFAAEPIAWAQTTTTTTTRTTVRHRYYRHKRTFWQKHRDKLTVAGAAAAGAGVGAIAGGKKGAAIGTAVGAGSGAVYTYGIRKRHRRHYRRY